MIHETTKKYVLLEETATHTRRPFLKIGRSLARALCSSSGKLLTHKYSAIELILSAANALDSREEYLLCLRGCDDCAVKHVENGFDTLRCDLVHAVRDIENLANRALISYE